MKKCFKCGVIKGKGDFYKHPQMADGLLGKCKECTKKDSEARRIEKEKDPEWAELEAERHRVKSRAHTIRKKGFSKGTVFKRFDFGCAKSQKIANNKLGNAVRDGKIKRMPCCVCGKSKTEGHHEDYSNPLDVIWLCKKHHTDRHSHLNENATLGAEIVPIQKFILIMKYRMLHPS
tara:strand:+ start:167 stop:694 length:528 start_codon:yes stop_codon:yes gene_type:complete